MKHETILHVVWDDEDDSSIDPWDDLMWTDLINQMVDVSYVLVDNSREIGPTK